MARGWRRLPGFPLIVALVVAYMLSLALMFVASRYRFPCVALMAVLAAVTLERFGEALRNRKAAETASLVALAAACFIVASWAIPRTMSSDNVSAARFNLGNLYLEKGQLDEAAKEYLKIPRSDPNYPRSRHNLGVAYERQGLVDAAVAEYEQVLEVKPDHARTHNNIGQLYFKKGVELAFRHFRQALALRPDFDAAQLNLGRYYLDRGQLGEAEEEYRRALSANPENAAAHYGLAVLAYKGQDYDKAIGHYREAVRLGHRENREFREALQSHERTASE